MDETRLKALLVAEQRGILPPEMAAALNVARERGLVPGAVPAPPTTPPPAIAEALENGLPGHPNATGLGRQIPGGYSMPDGSIAPMPDQPDLGARVAEALPIDMDKLRRDVVTAGGAEDKGTTAALSALNGLTFGLGDEGVGAMNALKTGLTDGFSAMPEAYREGRDNVRAAMDVGEEENRGLALGSEVAGSIFSPAGIAAIPKLAKAGPLGKIMGGTALGTAGAAAYGFSDGEGGFEGRGKGAIEAMPWGAGGGALFSTLGLLGSKAVSAIKQRKANVNFAKGAPDAAALKGKADDLYDAARATNAFADGPEVALLQADILTKMRKGALMTKAGKFLRPYKDAKAVIDYLDDYVKGGMSADDMLAFRSMVSDMAENNNKKIRRVMGGIKRQLDDFISPKIGPVFDEAKDTYARGMRTETLEGIEETARDKGSSYYTQAGYEHALRLQYKNLLKRIRDGKVRGYGDDEIAAMQRIVDGGPVENALRRLGQAAPKNPLTAGATYSLPGVLGLQLGIPPGVLAGGGAALYGAGRAAGHAAGKMQENNAGILRAITGLGQTPPLLPPPQGTGILDRLMMTGAPIGTQ